MAKEQKKEAETVEDQIKEAEEQAPAENAKVESAALAEKRVKQGVVTKIETGGVVEKPVAAKRDVIYKIIIEALEEHETTKRSVVFTDFKKHREKILRAAALKIAKL
jgi:hypothetical protein